MTIMSRLVFFFSLIIDDNHHYDHIGFHHYLTTSMYWESPLRLNDPLIAGIIGNLEIG